MESEGNYFHTFYFQAFSDQFALVSEEVSQLADEGESLLSNSNADADGALSAKLQDVRERFLRIQDLVEKQNEFERFENAVQDYRTKFDAVNSEISSGVRNIGITRGSVEVNILCLRYHLCFNIWFALAIFTLCSLTCLARDIAINTTFVPVL